MDDLHDTLANDESFDYPIETRIMKSPPLELVHSSSSKNRSEVEPILHQSRSRTSDYISINQPFNTPQHGFDEREQQIYMKTAEFESHIDNETDTEFSQNYYKNNKRPYKSPQKVTQRESVRNNGICARFFSENIKIVQKEMIRNLKQTIEALNFDNNTLREDIQDYKKAMEFLVAKHKELQV